MDLITLAHWSVMPPLSDLTPLGAAMINVIVQLSVLFTSLFGLVLIVCTAVCLSREIQTSRDG